MKVACDSCSKIVSADSGEYVSDCAEKMLDANLNNIYQISTESTMTFEEAADNIKAIVLKNGITVNEAIRKYERR